MTKATIVPHLLEQLSVELSANGAKFDTCRSFGVQVRLVVQYEPVSERFDEAHFTIKQALVFGDLVLTGEGALIVELMSGYDVLDLIPKSQVAAIEENLLAQMCSGN